MANHRHLEVLEQGIETWNAWRLRSSETLPDLSGARLTERDLSHANFRGADLQRANLVDARLDDADLTRANLSGANLYGARAQRSHLHGAELAEAHLDKADLHDANLWEANLAGADLEQAALSGATLSYAVLTGADLRWANLIGADLFRASLHGADLSNAYLQRARLPDADLRGANLTGAHLDRTDLRGADLTGALLTRALLVETDLEGADLTGCSVYGASVWGLKLDRARQSDLLITPFGEPAITVDNLAVAQFVYLLLDNASIRDVIDTIGAKAVLILGRFTPERKAVLDAMREELRRRNYLPILFDFEKPAGRDVTETVSTLAHLSRFVIADITEAKSIPQELQAIVPQLPSVPIQPLLLASEYEYGMFEHFRNYGWVLDVHRYRNADELIATIGENVIAPAEAKVEELEARRLRP